LSGNKTVQQQGPAHFDIIFMDSRMPKMNGLVTTQRLREQGYRHLIIGFTGNAMKEDVGEFLAAGVDVSIFSVILATLLTMSSMLL
jgi:CheY-like chemotaxis protein